MADQDQSDKPGFWHTLPGTLTALAAVITAITGLIVGLHQAGILGGDEGANQPSSGGKNTASIESSSSSGTGTSGPRKTKPDERQTQMRGQGRVTTPEGSFDFAKITGMAMERGELTVSQFGAQVEIPLDKIVRIKFLEGNLIAIDYTDGRSEEAKFHCYWNTPVTFHTDGREIYYGDCTALKVVEEIEFYQR